VYYDIGKQLLVRVVTSGEYYFEDSKKYKNITSVCQNVIAQHHNSLKDAIINIQQHAGIENKVGILPRYGTITERTNYLRKLVLGPKAWFSVNKTISSFPFYAKFEDLSFSLGTDGANKKTRYSWYFDLIKSTSSSSNLGSYIVNPQNPDSIFSYEKLDSETRQINYTYNSPGYYTVGLYLENDFGKDFIV
jgi:PKD repeat protein